MKEIEAKLGYAFGDSGLLVTALTHSSYANENRRSGAECNERLEFLGDSILGFTVAKCLYRRYPDMPEGRMTRLRAELVCEQSLVRVAQELDLGKYLRLGKGEENTGGRSRHSMLADCVEAVIAAMFLDGGLDVAEGFINRFILSTLDTCPPDFTDYKTALQELVQQKTGQVLSYEMTGQSGPDHMKVFSFAVLLNGTVIGSGDGRTKKEAEQAAAKMGLDALKNGAQA